MLKAGLESLRCLSTKDTGLQGYKGNKIALLCLKQTGGLPGAVPFQRGAKRQLRPRSRGASSLHTSLSAPLRCRLPLLQPASAQRQPPRERKGQTRQALPYLGNELEEGVGVESSNRQSYEVEEQPLVKGLLHEGHHAGSHQRAEGDDGHAEETVTPDCGVRAKPTPGNRTRGGCRREGRSTRGRGGRGRNPRRKERERREGEGGERRGHSLVIACSSGIGSRGANLVLSGSGNSSLGRVGGKPRCGARTERLGEEPSLGAGGSLNTRPELSFGNQAVLEPAPQLCSPSPHGTSGGCSSATERRGPPSISYAPPSAHGPRRCSRSHKPRRDAPTDGEGGAYTRHVSSWQARKYRRLVFMVQQIKFAVQELKRSLGKTSPPPTRPMGSLPESKAGNAGGQNPAAAKGALLRGKPAP